MRLLPLVLPAVALAGSALPAQFHDDFTGKAPLTGWTWSDPGNDCKYQMGPLPGQLRMIVPPGNDHTTGHSAPLYAGSMLTVKATGDFVLTTRVTVNYPSSPAAMESGLMIWKDQSNNLQFKRTNAYNSQNVLLYGNIANSQTSFHGNVQVSANQLYMRIERSGTTFTASYGTDGKAWTKAGSVTWNVTGTLEVGLSTSFWLWWGSTTTPATGDYDFFDVSYPATATMTADRAGVSAASGGAIGLAIDKGKASAGQVYLVLGSLSGSTPGIKLPGGKTLPLNFDPLFDLMVQLPGAAGLFPGTVGLLDASGQAKAQVLMPGTVLTPIQGGALRFAAVLFPPSIVPMDVTDLVVLGIAP
ncbi:MAG: hypothetical protein R3F30_07195 [Planctomycetota bacterium]